MLSIPYKVEKTITIYRSLAEVFTAVSDFSTWARWSPWLCLDPDCTVSIDKPKGTVGHRQAWEGKLIGSGEMRISSLKTEKSIDYDLQFIKPWKSRSLTSFQFSPDGEGVRVEWRMQGKILFFMRKMMSALIGSDFERGLAMLKEYIETGNVSSELSDKGVAQRPLRYYVGIERTCSMAEVGPAMKADFNTLEKLFESSTLPEPQEVVSIYKKFDMVRDVCVYISGFLYDSLPKTPDGTVSGCLPDHQALKINHKGSYQHLGNAWSAAMSRLRARYKANKAVPMYEIYLNHPDKVAERDLLTDVYAPVKSS
ncbi:MAG: hypothetical protein B0D92_08275 [Spirochaeta sp. LUC14_002_19_P3]|nr:MAG: hypothetical protein B0D92_08275 [Spirochaeta sp. LUC14_002_19_P3]